jgi:signal transduction histidine kinase
MRSQSLRWAVDDDETEALLAAVREALNNVLQHAGVDYAQVTVAARDYGTLEVEVTDEGRGFDAATVSHGFGLENSVKRRIHDVGGSVVVQTTRGLGTSIRMSVPAFLKHDEVPKRPLLMPVSMRRPMSLEERALGWFVIPALVYRACLTPLQVTQGIASLPRYPSSLLLIAMSCVLLVDIALLITARSAFVMKLFSLPQFMVADFMVAAMLNVWVAIDLANGTALLPGREFLWGYMFGTMILWTALRGARAGAALMVLGIALESLVIVLNHDPINTPDVLQAAAQVAKLATAFVITWLIAQLARRGVRLAARAGEQSGREMERAEDLRQLYKGARDDLARIVEICASETDAPALRLQQIRGVALQQISMLDACVK